MGVIFDVDPTTVDVRVNGRVYTAKNRQIEVDDADVSHLIASGYRVHQEPSETVVEVVEEQAAPEPPAPPAADPTPAPLPQGEVLPEAQAAAGTEATAPAGDGTAPAAGE